VFYMEEEPVRPEDGDLTSETRPLARARLRPACETTRDDSFDALFIAYYQSIYRLLYRIVGTREEAEDLAQECFLRLHRASYLWDQRRPAQAGQHNVRAWLYRVATNLAYNVLRSRGRRAHYESIVDENQAGEDQATDPVEAVLRDDLRSAVRRTLARLPERQAQLLLLRHAGLSYGELASALNVAPGSVGTLLARAEVAFEKTYRATSSGKEDRDAV
jgi:RNA polymerase sigma-70 factor (ECF subfamily)